jgi:hypothetical protein
VAIYLFYFYQGAREAGTAGQAEQIPLSYLDAGAPANINGGIYQAGTENYKIAFYDTLTAGNNSMVPDPGLIFASVPVLTPAAPEDRQPNRQWILIDDSGRSYMPLSTDTGRLSNLKRLGDQELPPATKPDYLLFKVKSGARALYLKLSMDQTTLYWRLPGSP